MELKIFSQLLSYKCQKEVFLVKLVLLALLVSFVFNFGTNTLMKQYFDVFLEGELLDEEKKGGELVVCVL